MRALTILYHDVIGEDLGESGFPGEAAARYKLEKGEFAEHLAEIAAQTPAPFVAVPSDPPDSPEIPRLMTFDDGGASAIYIADNIEERGWCGHFFITTDYIDQPGFLTTAQVQDLHGRGHVVGSHSCSHPYRIAELPSQELDREWADSTARLADILGTATTTASVPGGFYTPRVAESAASAGITNLFTSEPTTNTRVVSGCRVLGRYNVYRGMSATSAASIVAGRPLRRYHQALTWGFKKTIKRVARPLWDHANRIYFKKGSRSAPTDKGATRTGSNSDPPQ